MKNRFDSSILGYTSDDVEIMDSDERTECAIECINRAADIVGEVMNAFPEQENPELRYAIEILITVARTTS